jgi:TonB family protein
MSSVSGYAQQGEQNLGFFSKYGEKLADSSGAAYYRTVESRNDNGYMLREYFLSGKPKMEAEVSAYIPATIYNGKKKIYYENGTLAEEGIYNGDTTTGEVLYYYENGSIRERREYAGEKRLLRQYYTPDGKELLVNGHGTIKDTCTKGGIVYSKFENYELVTSYQLNGSDTLVIVKEQPPQYVGGIRALFQDISNNLKYPKKARMRQIEGTVQLSFVVTKTGMIENIKIMKGIGGGCDEEALRVMSKLTDWDPGIQWGRFVNCRMVLPFMFKLSKS